MKRSIAAFALVLFAACSSAPAPKTTPQPPRLSNVLLPVTAATKTIVEPRIRVGMLSDQTSVTFPRVDGGYYLITNTGASILRRGFTDAAPLNATTIRYAVQAGAISDKPSAETFASRLRTDANQRV